MSSPSVNQKEVAQFSRLAEDWWNPAGAMKSLHKINPARLEYIRDTVCAHYGRGTIGGLSVLDVGCGGGLLCEPLARMGARVTGLDASRPAIAAARAHAAGAKLKIDYKCGSVEDLARGRGRFDVVTALEIVEHVADIDSLLRGAVALLRPGGIMILSTLNRTVKSFLIGIVAAEYVLRWVPRGTHDWRTFMRPSELAAHVRQAGMEPGDITGMVFDPLNDSFSLRPGMVGVNYLMSAVKSL